MLTFAADTVRSEAEFGVEMTVETKYGPGIIIQTRSYVNALGHFVHLIKLRDEIKADKLLLNNGIWISDVALAQARDGVATDSQTIEKLIAQESHKPNARALDPSVKEANGDRIKALPKGAQYYAQLKLDLWGPQVTGRLLKGVPEVWQAVDEFATADPDARKQLMNKVKGKK